MHPACALLLVFHGLPVMICHINVAQFRIVGGAPVVHIHEFPYQTSIQRNGKHSCGGAIISSRKILTAAHCVSKHKKNDLSILVGIKNLEESTSTDQQFTVANYTAHPKFNKDNLDHDIAVITLETEIMFDKTKNSTTLREKVVDPDENLIASGWGRTSKKGRTSQELQWVEVTALDPNKCKQSGKKSSHRFSRRKNICTSSRFGQGTCKGDSGGPLVDKNDQLVGVVSWGKPCATGFPDIYTSVSYHYEWIYKQLET